MLIKANFDGRIGAVGFVPLIVPRRFHPLAIIRVNNQTYEPVRDSNGLCIRAGTSENLTLILCFKHWLKELKDKYKNKYFFLCNIDEPGMFIGLIKEGDALREFNGYLDKEESKKKIIQDVFAKGDKAFLTGEHVYNFSY